MIPLLILGLLIQNPGSNGYALLSLMQERHYKYIVNFTKGSFYYHLQQLSEKGLINEIEAAVSSKESHHYVVTDAGKDHFKELMQKHGMQTEYVNLEFYGALLFSKEYGKDEMKALIRSQIEQSQLRIDNIEKALVNQENLEFSYYKMLENSKSHHEVNIKWFMSLLENLENL